MTSAEQHEMLYLFERPSDPLYMPRAGNTVVFNMPEPMVPKGFALRFGGGTVPNVIKVQTDASLFPSLPTIVSTVPRGGVFSLNLREHRLAAKRVIELLQQAQTVEQLRNIAVSIREDLNETLFVYALTFVITRNKAFRSLRVPAIVETFPGRFMPSVVIDRARSMINRDSINRNADQTAPIVINHDQDFSGRRDRLENRVSYWREDYGINAHHWHWHLVFPTNIVDTTPPDRKGELFYYMHQQMVARYDMERMSISLPRVRKLDNFRDPIPEGYFPKLRFENSGDGILESNPNATLWGSRQDDTRLSNYTRLNTLIPVDLSELELWRDRLLDGIHQGYLIRENGERVPLSDEVDITDGTRKRGIDIIGDSLEADRDLSVNYNFYGDLHNFAHVLIGGAHDPDGTHGENLGVMSDSAVAPRDPVFFRLHKFVDWIFQQYKATQPSYTVQQLELPGVTISRLGVATGTVADELQTGWNRREIEASRGIDFNTPRSVRVRLQHMDHKPFDYHILVDNTTGNDLQVYVRLFLAPKFSHNSETIPMMLSEQRLLWSEMDKFAFTLKPGQNHIKRPSSQSSIAIPGERTFRELEQRARGNMTPEGLAENFCGCGWPQHLLVPRGRPEGMTFQLFCIMTDFLEDMIPQPEGKRQCAGAVAFCGILDARYPDKRPMGYPFDRLPPRELRSEREQVLTVTDLARLSNIAVHDITVRFLGEELNPSEEASPPVTK